MSHCANRRERKKINSKNAIIDAAVQLFSEKGYSETSIAEIMNQADLGIGTFYNYFQSKEDILKHFLTNIIVDTKDLFSKLSQQNKTAAESLTELFLFTGRTLAQNKFVLPLFLGAADKMATSRASVPIMEGLTFKAVFDDIIKQGQENGEFRQDIPAEVITEMFHSVFQAASFSSLEMSFRQNIEYKLRLILDGLIIK